MSSQVAGLAQAGPVFAVVCSWLRALPGTPSWWLPCSVELVHGGAVPSSCLCGTGDPSPGRGAEDRSLSHGSRFCLSVRRS